MPAERRLMIERLAVLPLLMLIFAGFLLRQYRFTHAYEPRYLLATLNMVFISLSSLVFAWVCGINFLSSGIGAILLMGVGAALVGLVNGIAGLVIHDFNLAVTIHNTGMFAAGLVHFFAVVSAALPAHPVSFRSRRSLLWLCYTASAAAVCIVTFAATAGAAPIFYDQLGPTSVRQAVLGISVMSFSAAGILCWSLRRRTRLSLLFWYSLSLALTATGLAEVMLAVPGSILAWLGRAGQSLGGLYLLAALMVENRGGSGFFHSHSLAFSLAQAEADYRPMVESVSDAIVSLDKTGNILYWNSAAERILERRASEVFGLDFAEVITGGDGAKQIQDKLKSVMSTSPDGSHTIEGRICGNDRFADVEISFLRGGDGGTVIAIIKDISERKWAEAALRQSRDKLEEIVADRTAENRRLLEILEATTDLVVLADADGKILYLNNAARRVAGLGEEEDLSQVAASKFMPRHVLASLDADSADGKDIWRGESIVMASNGRELPVSQVVICHRAPDGAVRYISTIARDITFRKKIEEDLRSANKKSREIVERIADGFIAVDQDWHITYVNRIAARWSRCATEHITGAIFWDYFPFAGTEFEKAARQAMAEQAVMQFEFKPTPNECWDISLYPASDGMTIYCVDATHRKRAEDHLKQWNTLLEQKVAKRTNQLRHLTSELARAEQHERDRIASVLHDNLQQLLAAAKMRAGIMKYRAKDQGIETQAGQIEHLLGEAIDVTRSLSTELSPPIMSGADFSATLDWLADWMREKHSLDVNLKCDGEVNIESMELKHLLFQSVRELLFNVVKHAETKTAEVVLERSANGVKITVADAGKGFEQQWLEQGFGLLSISERLVHAGGRLDISSKPLEGTRVVITAPTAPQACAQPEKFAASSTIFS